MKNVTTLSNHFGVGVYGTHPIFNAEFMPENIASLVETVLLFTELGLLFVFGFSAICLSLHIDNAATVLINDSVDGLFKFFRTNSTLNSNLIAFDATLLATFITKRYFDWIKYNLHPKQKSTH